jgi:hypothetical protein
MTTLLVYFHGSGSNGPEFRNYLDNTFLKTYRKSFCDVLSDLSIDIITPTATLQKYIPCANELMNVWFNRSANFDIVGRDDVEYIDGIEISIKIVCIKYNILPKLYS